VSTLPGGSSSPKVVAVGGGHGLAASLRAVRRYTDDVTAVVSVAEPGSLLAAAFAHRFAEEELAGHALGNLVLAGLMEAAGDPIAGIDEACRLLGVRGRVLPATTDPVVLKADADAGNVAGQVAVMATDHIHTVSVVPADPKATVEAIEALERADQIVIGPGSLFTSVLAAIAVPDIREGINRSGARKIYVCNLRPQVPETEGFDVAMHVGALVDHGVTPDLVVCDPAGLATGHPPVTVVEASLARPNGLAHDPTRLAAVLSGLLG